MTSDQNNDGHNNDGKTIANAARHVTNATGDGEHKVQLSGTAQPETSTENALRQALNAVDAAMSDDTGHAAVTPPPPAAMDALPQQVPLAPMSAKGAADAETRQGGPDMNSAKTQIVRGQRRPTRTDFHQEPVVAWLVVIGGPGLGAFRPLFTGNNTIGRSPNQRVPIDFGDDAISSEEQAYIRYDAADREFLFVPNLSKTNVVSVNEAKPTAAQKLAPMDVITMGQTQLVFVPFCGEEFDWSELADL